jgi:hypothetical protein
MKMYKKEYKPWQKQHKKPSHLYYTDENGERRHIFLVSLRFLRVAFGFKGSMAIYPLTS